jgi:hypothetical protein
LEKNEVNLLLILFAIDAEDEESSFLKRLNLPTPFAVCTGHESGYIVSRFPRTYAVHTVSGAKFSLLLFELMGIQALVARFIAGNPVSCKMCPFAEGAYLFLITLLHKYPVFSRNCFNRNCQSKK